MDVCERLESPLRKVMLLPDFIEMAGLLTKQTMVADLSHQANRKTRWSEEMMSMFFRSSVLNQLPAPIVIVDLEKCLEHAKKRNNQSDIAYFTLWLITNGARYLILDGNNRIMVTKKILNDEVKLPTDIPLYTGDKLVQKSDIKLGATFSTLNKALRDSFDTSQVSLHIYTELTEEKMGLVFQIYNLGSPLNDPEFRNSFGGLIVKAYRDLADTWETLFEKLDMTSTNTNRRSIEQWMAYAFNIWFHDIKKPCTKKVLDDLSLPHQKSTELEITGFEKAMNTFLKIVDTSKIVSLRKSNAVLDAWAIYVQQTRVENKVFKNDETTLEFTTDVADAIYHLLELKGNDGKAKTYETGKDVFKTFKTLLGNKTANNNNERNKLILEQLGDLDKYFVPKTKRVASDLDASIVANSQNWKTKDGTLIPYDQLNKFHKGHKVPFSKSKDSSIENLIIQTPEENLKLGAKEAI